MNQPPWPKTPPAVAADSPPLGYLSPDGAWEWNGLTWVPRGPALPVYSAARPRCRWAVALLMVWSLSAVLVIVAELGRLDLVNKIIAGTYVTPSEADGSDSFVLTAVIVNLGAYVVAGVAFLLWIHRIVANNYSLGARALRFTPGWAVGWWFVPIANLGVPERVVEEAWRAADPSLSNSTPDTRRALGVPFLVRLWWGVWIVGLLLGVGAGEVSGTSASSIADSTVGTLIAMGLRLAADLLAIVVVVRLTARQERLHAGTPTPLAS